MIPVCIILAAVALLVGLAATLLAAALDRAKWQLAATEQRLAARVERVLSAWPDSLDELAEAYFRAFPRRRGRNRLRLSRCHSSAG